MLLVFEMAVFMALIVPMPFKWKRGLFTFLAESPIVAKIQYGMKVTEPIILLRIPLTSLDNIHLHFDTVPGQCQPRLPRPG